MDAFLNVVLLGLTIGIKVIVKVVKVFLRDNTGKTWEANLCHTHSLHSFSRGSACVALSDLSYGRGTGMRKRPVIALLDIGPIKGGKGRFWCWTPKKSRAETIT